MTPEELELELNTAHIISSGVNENPEFVMKEPNELLGFVGSLGGVCYGPNNLEALMLEYYQQLSQWHKEGGQPPKPTPEFRERHPEWGYPINIDLKDDRIPRKFLWDAYLVESLVFESIEVAAAVLSASKDGFSSYSLRRVQTALRLHVVPKYKQRHEREYEQELTAAVWQRIRESMIKALPKIAEWTVACFCYEVSFWSSILSKNMDEIKAAENKLGNDGATSTGMVFAVSTGKTEPEPEPEKESDVIAAYKRRKQRRAKQARQADEF